MDKEENLPLDQQVDSYMNQLRHYQNLFNTPKKAEKAKRVLDLVEQWMDSDNADDDLENKLYNYIHWYRNRYMLKFAGNHHNERWEIWDTEEPAQQPYMIFEEWEYEDAKYQTSLLNQSTKT